jgi:hypothetical protein
MNRKANTEADVLIGLLGGKPVNKSKNIGTWAESRVVAFLQANDFPDAKRRALAGALDEGDILVCPGVVAEVKGGHAGEDASDGQLKAWRAETERERIHAKAHLAFLVVKRKGHGVLKVGGWTVVPTESNSELGMLTKFRLDEYVDNFLIPHYGEE